MKRKEKKILLRRFIQSYLSSVISISLVLVITGCAAIIGVNAGAISNYFKENLKLSLIFEESATEQDALAMLEKVKKAVYVKSVSYVSKEQGAMEMKQLLGEDFTDIFEMNPIPMSLDIFLKANYVSSDSIAVIEMGLSDDPMVRELVYQETLIEAVANNMEKLGLVAAAVIALFLFVSIVLINNTIRLNVFTRRFTIHTMKMVGAKRSFIRKPFMLHGFYQGLISGAISVGVIIALIYYAKREFAAVIDIFKPELVLYVLGGVMIAGILICLISTYFVVNRLASMSVDEIYY